MVTLKLQPNIIQVLPFTHIKPMSGVTSNIQTTAESLNLSLLFNTLNNGLLVNLKILPPYHLHPLFHHLP